MGEGFAARPVGSAKSLPRPLAANTSARRFRPRCALRRIAPFFYSPRKRSRRAMGKRMRHNAYTPLRRGFSSAHFQARRANSQTLAAAASTRANHGELEKRMGLCPGFCTPIGVSIPSLGRPLSVGMFRMGFDILSFDLSGRDRMIEVKTTSFGKETPFFITRAEVNLSRAESDAFCLFPAVCFSQEATALLAAGTGRLAL